MPRPVLRGVGVRLEGDRSPLEPAAALTALATLRTCNGLVGFKFQDTIATYVDDRDKDHPDGYGARETPDKYGTIHARRSHVAGLVGATVEVLVFPAQFGIPCEWGTHFYFKATPGDLLQPCVDAVADYLCPLEYHI